MMGKQKLISAFVTWAYFALSLDQQQDVQTAFTKIETKVHHVVDEVKKFKSNVGISMMKLCLTKFFFFCFDSCLTSR